MIFNALKTALISLWGNKVRAVLNLLGVVIGVFAVTILISLGQGLKENISSAIEGFGSNMIFVIAGKVDVNNPNASSQMNPANLVSGDIITLDDLKSIAKIDHVKVAAPMSLVSGELRYNGKTSGAMVVGTYPNILDAMEVLKLDKGRKLSTSANTKEIVLGSTPATDLFGSTDPIGKKVTINNTELTVIGTLKKTKNASMFGSQFDTITGIPFDTATEFNKGQVKIYRLVAKVDDASNIDYVKNKMRSEILANHGGQEDFTVLTAGDLVGLLNTFINLATTLISAIAAISLIVGGIGIMNIMLVTVTERTREIGLRKAVGATNAAILFQFLIEAVVVTFLGAMIGLIASFIGDIIISSRTELTPVISASTIIFAVSVSVAIGVIFGLWPAIRAAKKDPIDALRYE